jgi:hypothetical protein
MPANLPTRSETNFYFTLVCVIGRKTPSPGGKKIDLSGGPFGIGCLFDLKAMEYDQEAAL